MKSKAGDRSRRRPEGSVLLYRSVGEGATPFSGLLYFTLDTFHC